jgi:glycerol uptake facilitator-like aquaporin
VKASLAQRTVAECLGTAFLLAAVVGSGIMAARLAGGNGAPALLCNTLPTGAILTVLILTLGPISGAHFNPAVSAAMALRGELAARSTAIYIGAQVIGGILGIWAAHLMFELPLWQVAATTRTGPGQWFAEAIATFGLVLTILGCSARTPPVCLTRLDSTLRRRIGLPPQLHSLIPLSRSRARYLTPSLGSHPPGSLHLSPRSSLACSRPLCLAVG